MAIATLTPDECRVLGVLVEKELTTPGQYPLSLNSIITGCNQKSNREPAVEIDEDRSVAAVEGLREKKLVIFAETLGSRVMKYKHNAAEVLGVGVRELVMLTEMLLRGPQTVGELRTRASRMHPLESLDVVQNTLQYMLEKPEPLVRRIPPAPGSRAERFGQLLCPDLHPIDGGGASGIAGTSEPAAATLAQRVAQLEEQVTLLRGAIEKLGKALGEPDILPPLPLPPAEPASGPVASEPQ